MKISLNWLKKYIQIDLPPEEISEILTMIGLEVEGMEVVEGVKGGLQGVVVGEVITCGKHPNADTLSLTTVNIGSEDLIQIVCGAPNVAAGQKVLVSTVGTTLYNKDGEAWKIKKGKIRGEVSEGMICAEDELGLGDDHEGIMVLDKKAVIGMPAKDHLGLESDIVFEIGLTPNRSDATGHIGVAQDLAAYLKINYDYTSDVIMPEVSDFKVDMQTSKIDVSVENNEACPRYSGVVIKDLTISESPDWLKKYLTAVDVRPINVIVDITNFVLHELSQPLHAFDLDKIKGDAIVVKTLPEGSAFMSLDDQERKLSEEDLMICNGKGEGMCIGGVFGGKNSGVTENTSSIFLEAAHFEAGWIRRSSTRHNLRTDAAKVFEKGSDPNVTVYALKRAALLMKELAGGIISSEVIDIYPKEIKRKEIHVKYANVTRLIGTNISNEEIHQILRALDIEIEAVDSESVMVHVPTNKSDVTREVDVIEEILRIYGFNKVPLNEQLVSKVSYEATKEKHTFRNKLATLLNNQGFNEMMGMSLIESRHILELELASEKELVFINNTSNTHLDIMRPEMMVSGLLSVLHNHNRQNLRLRLFEFGKSFRTADEGFEENEFLTVFLSGLANEESWRNTSKAQVDFYDIKKVVHNILARLNVGNYQISEIEGDSRYSYGLKYHRGPKSLASFGKVSNRIASHLDLKSEVFYAELSISALYKAQNGQISATEISKFPSIRRDLAMIINSNTKFDIIKKIAIGVDKKNLKEINLFDVYENEEHLGKDKKSYAISLIFRDENKTLKDKEVEKIVNQIIKKLESEVSAEIRK